MTESRKTTKSVKLTERCHDRLTDVQREGETLSGAVERAIDALEREEDLPDAVTEVLRDDE